MTDSIALDTRIRVLGQRLLETAAQSSPSGRHAWLDKLILRAIGEPGFRVQTLRFIDVLPTLRDDAELAGHLKEYFTGLELPWPEVSAWSLRHSDAPWAVHIAAPLVRATLRALSRRFMGGRSLREAPHTIERLRRRGMGYTLDLLGEAVVSEAEAQRYQQACLALLQGLPPGGDADSETHRPQISLKLSALYSQLNPLDPEGGVAAIAARLRPILSAARAWKIGVTVDMEQYDFKHIVVQCFMTVLMEPEFRDWPDAGIAMQAYLREARDDLRQLIDWAERRGAPVQVRLVQRRLLGLRDGDRPAARLAGAGVDGQGARPTRASSDCLEVLFANPEVAASGGGQPQRPQPRPRHGARGAAAFAGGSLRVPDALRHGRSDSSGALVQLGYRVRVYMPFGETPARHGLPGAPPAGEQFRPEPTRQRHDAGSRAGREPGAPATPGHSGRTIGPPALPQPAGAPLHRGRRARGLRRGAQ